MRIAEKSERTTREKGEFLMKHKARTKAMSWLLSLALTGALTLGLLPAISSPALAAEGDTSYTITIPSTLTVANKGWNATDGISATGTLADGKKLTVTATSANSWALKSGENSVGYKLATASTDTEATTSWTFDSLSSTAATKPMGIIVENYDNKPAGTYQDTVTFTASVEAANVSLSDFKENGAVLQVAFKQTDNKPLSVTLKNDSGTVSCTEYKFNGYNGSMSQLTVSLSGDKLTISKTGSTGTAQLEFDLNNSTYSMVQMVSEVTAVSVNGIDITSKLSAAN